MPSVASRPLQVLAAAVLLAVQPLAVAVAADGYVTTNEAKLDLIFKQASFGLTPIDIRFNPSLSIVNAALASIDSAADWTTLLGLAGNAASPTVNMYFVDKVLWCGSPSITTIGCAMQPGNVIVLNSSWAANATYGGILAGHELAHNLGLGHLAPDDGTNLMNPTISTSSFLSGVAPAPPPMVLSQVATILASAQA